jgi:hypothetical protein
MELEAKMKKIEQKVDDEKLKTLAHYNEMKEIREKKHNEAQRRKEEKIQQKIEKVEIKKKKTKELKLIEEDTKKKTNGNST